MEDQNTGPEQPLPENPEQSVQKRFKDMDITERRKYLRELKQRSRERQRLEQEANEIPAAADYIVPEKWDRELSSYSKQTLDQVRKELGPITTQDEYIVSAISEVSLGLERGFLQRVQLPMGIMVGSFFPEALGAEAISHLSANPGLLNSPAFMDIYHRVLVQIAKWADKAPTECVNRESISRIREELR